LVGITCVEGNSSVDNAAKNTLMTLKICDRLDIPVYKGARSSLIAKENVPVGFHGEDGLNNVYKEDEKPSDELLQKSHAVEALRNFIELYPNDLTILSLAPLTNIALLYKLYPEISQKIKSLYIMGGNHLGVGNTTMHAEFNFWFDPGKGL
jgi:inosine-uridine nucleoside N-ribohydrolase